MKEVTGQASSNRGRIAILITAITIPFLLIYLLPNPADPAAAPSNVTPIPLPSADKPAFVPALDLPLPALYQEDGHDPIEEPGVCSDRYGGDYIRKFSRRATNMCEHDATATLTCFTHQAWDDVTDTFCMGTPAMIDPKAQSIFMDCPLHNFTEQEQERGAHMIDTIPMSWYNTGPRYLFEKYMHLDSGVKDTTGLEGQDRIALLVKREGGNVIPNAWHQLMQVMSLGVSLDVLRTTRDPATKQPMYSDEDYKNTQVIILDDDEEGPFYDVWSMFGGLPTIRLADSPPLAPNKVLLPISGGSNPIWITRTQTPPCSEAILLSGFVKRIMNFYQFPTLEASGSGDKINLVFVNRTNYRMLVDQEAHIAALSKLLAEKYPHINLEVVDFAQVGTFRQQIEKARTVDILVGVHGAGLTHTLWLPANATVVELQPPGLRFFGFEMLSRFMGHGYFQQYTDVTEYEGMTHNWQADNVFMTEEKFLGVIETAIQKRTWQEDYHDRRLGFPKDP